VTPIKIGFIGAGKVGFSLGKYFSENNLDVIGYYSRTLTSSKEAANFTNTKFFEQIEDLIDVSDIIFITTPDDEIYNTWMHIKNYNLNEKIICHASGYLSSTIFSDIKKSDAYAYSIHPLFPISNKYESYKKLKDCVFTIEGDEKYLQSIIIMFEKLNNKVIKLQSQDKTLYHLAAVTSSNLVNALLSFSCSYLKDYGFTEDEAIKALFPLIETNINNVKTNGLMPSLTGPVERCDLTTVKKHIDVIPKEQKDIYTKLSLQLLTLSRIKNPNTNYGQLEEYLIDQEGKN
jgi:predicted short-subunit dehydrogenase-like oxidoreductase (DUF2520 family)